jgi:hypothetical protein
MLQVALRQRPLAGGLTLWNALSCVYLAIFCCYWVFALVRPHDLVFVR